MSKIFKLILVFLLLFSLNFIYAEGTEPPKINIVYPSQNASIKASSTFFIGSTNPKATLKINGNLAKVYPNGAFVEIVPLVPGNNSFSLVSTMNGVSTTKTYTLKRTNVLKTLSSSTLEIDDSSIYPTKNMTLNSSDTLEVKFRGTSVKDFKKNTPIKAYFTIGDNVVEMSEMPEQQAKKRGIYRGFYKIQKSDDFDKEPINIFFETDGIKSEKTAPGHISTIADDFYVVGRVITDKAVVRNQPDPNTDRLSPMRKNTLVALNGEFGDYFRIKLSDKKKVWMPKKDIDVAELTDCPPISDLSKLNIYSDDSSMFIVVPLEYQAPILVNNYSQNKLEVNIYGLKDNILPQAEQTIKSNDLNISYSQTDSKSAKISIIADYKHLWGFDYYFKDKHLIIEITKQPEINPEKPLQNIIIALDPGHGGQEKGSVGPTGVPEKTINLQIAKYLQQELQNAGAKVIMTRTTDVDTEIYSRVNTANKNNALLLISLHNNALPDGQNPYITHGTSAYYYQPQAFGLAQRIQKNLAADLKLQNNGVHRQSFVLTRPTKPLSVLIEVAFMINPDEYTLLLNDTFKKNAAKSIRKSIEQFMISSRVN